MHQWNKRCGLWALPFVLAWPVLGAEEKKPLPKWSEKAVAAVQESFPRAVIDEVAEPKGFGSGNGKVAPLFWSIRFHVGENKQELSVTPEGTIIRMPTPVEVKDLPRAVSEAIAKSDPDAKIRSAEKHELRATMKYVALAKPQVRQYLLDVVDKDGKRFRVSMGPDGAGAKATAVPEAKKDDKEKKADKPAEEKEITIPKEAAKAVKAIKELYSDAVVKQITTEVFDDGSGTLEILTYEVEFIYKGTKREMVASPEGVIPHLWLTLEPKDLPKEVTAALDKVVPGAKVMQARRQEIRASLRFAPVDKPRLYYTVRIEKDKKESTIKVKPDGTLIKKFEFPQKKN